MSTSWIVTITNQKGGVGKTTTAVNLGQALAFLSKWVLLVDLDPQSNSTQNFGIAPEMIQVSVCNLIKEKERAVKDVFWRGAQLTSTPDLPHFDLVPASPLLAQVEREMVGMTNSEFRLANKLNAIRHEYDFILIDTPPTLGPLLNSGLNAADWVIIR